MFRLFHRRLLYQNIRGLWEWRIMVLAAEPEAVMKRAVRAMITVGLLRADTAGQLTLEPPAALLRSDVPGSMRANVLVLSGEQSYEGWGDIVYSMQTGKIGLVAVSANRSSTITLKIRKPGNCSTKRCARAQHYT